MKRYPDHPGHRGVNTSIEAAEALVPHLNRLRRLSLEAVRGAGPAGLTSKETAALLGIDYNSIHPRLSELKKRRLVRDSGQRRKNPSGRNAIVWVAVDWPEKPGAIPCNNPPKGSEDDDA